MKVDRAFWKRVDRAGTHPDDCWIWRGAQTRDGYGKLGRNGRTVLAHRYAYELEVGPIPGGRVIDHLCRVRLCVRPSHAEPVTARENILRGEGAGALAARRDRCPEGHELTNSVDGSRRRCRPCAADAARRYRARNRIEVCG